MLLGKKKNGLGRWLLVGLLAVVSGIGVGCSSSADGEAAKDQNEKEKASQAADASKEKENSGVSEDAFKLPEQVSKETLSDLLDSLEGIEQQASTETELFSILKKKQQVILKATDLALKLEDLKEDEAIKFVHARVQALVNLANLGDEERFGETLEFLKQYEASDSQKIAETAADLAQQVKTLFPQYLTEEQLKSVTESLLKPAEEFGLNRFNMGPIEHFAMELDQYELYEQAAALYERLGELGAQSNDPRVSDQIEMYKGAARRLRSKGKKLDVYGTTMDGETFDWESYRGKVVLVDFWATWCGPCIAELPNVQKLYELYKGRGFDVVGVSKDDNPAAVASFLEKREIPWTNLIIDPAGTPAGKVPLDVHYGVITIPRPILVDREGKVVSLNARGPQLEELLKELLGTPTTD